MPVGFAIGWYRSVRTFVDPLINFFRALPPIALIPLVIVYFGIGEAAKTVILFYASFFAGVIVMVEGIGQDQWEPTCSNGGRRRWRLCDGDCVPSGDDNHKPSNHFGLPGFCCLASALRNAFSRSSTYFL